MHRYTSYVAARGLRLSRSRAVCLHAVLGVTCPDFGALCRLDAPRPFARIMDHRILFRLGNDRVFLTEPYVTPEDASESARILAEVLNLRFAVGAPGSGPWAAGTDPSGDPTALLPIAFAETQSLADLAVSTVSK